jgi:hypothetical protein
MCAQPIWPSFQATQAKKATIATTIIMVANRVLFANMLVLGPERLAVKITAYALLGDQTTLARLFSGTLPR